MNEKITDFQGVVAHIDRNNIDTDQIIPTEYLKSCLLYTSPSPRDKRQSRMPSSA